MIKDMTHEQLTAELDDLPLFRKLALIEYLALIVEEQAALELKAGAVTAVKEYSQTVTSAAKKCRQSFIP